MSTPAPTEIKRPSIKKVVIHGFLSYGDEGDIEEFDPGMNVLGMYFVLNFLRWPNVEIHANQFFICSWHQWSRKVQLHGRYEKLECTKRVAFEKWR